MSSVVNNFVKKVVYWTIPQGFLALIQEFRNRKTSDSKKPFMTGPYDDPVISRNKKFHNLHAGERCFILATGPSVNNQDLRVLSGELCIAVGQFHLHEHIKDIQPRYHVVAPSHPPFDFSDLEKLFTGFKDTYSDDMTYFLGHTPYEYSLRNYLQEFSSQSFRNSYFIDYTNTKSLDEHNLSNPDIWDIALSPFAIRTVIYEAIQVAVYMGVKEVYLIGCDHDYILDMDRVTNHHFYAEESGISDVEHLSSFTTERWFEEYYYRWKQYRLMNEYCKQNGGGIFNATEGGLLDVFPRVTLSDLL